MSRIALRHPLSRRAFLRVGAAAGASALLLPDTILADPPVGRIRLTASDPVRVGGRVLSRGTGVAGVAISDGWDVVATDAEGRFELITTADRDFVRMTVPAGYQIPRNPVGTARFYEPLNPGANGEMSVAFDLDPLEEPEENHALFLLADIQTEDAQEMAWFHEQTVPDVQETLRALGPPQAVGIADGDIMFDHLELYPEFEKAVSRMGIPFFQVVGNHDLDQEAGTDGGSTRTFCHRFGPRYYSFDRGAVHYVVLDDVFWHGAGYLGYLGSDQLRWLENDLRFVETGRPVIVACHIPVLGGRHVRTGAGHPAPGISVANRRLLYHLLEPYQSHILTGHTHENEHVFEGGTHEHVSGTVCGAWWSGPICGDGTPGGYSVYEIMGEEVTWRYKSTGHDFQHQLRVYPRGADPKAPDEMVANVWDWDPAWTVVWYEDGERRGEMARRVGTDPLAEELLRGDELPPRRTWADPYPVGHLFYAPASPQAREIRVEATDRFGRIYSGLIRS
ncbi:MAG: calcineurin-like phosphoesterase family protein [Longimicrobiales bacterium]